MQFSDEEQWKKFVKEVDTDGYGLGCLHYAKEWAEKMERMMRDGATVEQCAKKASEDADTIGINVRMYGCAVSMLAKCWKHGEELRRWHNKNEQIGTEGDLANETGGVLKSSVLNVSEPAG